MITATPIDALPRTSTVTINRLKKLGIQNYINLLYYFPFRYENFSLISPISRLQPGESVTLQGQITEIKTDYTRRGLTIQKAVLQDDSGQIRIVWYNQPFLVKLLQNKRISIAGSVESYRGSISFSPKEYELINFEEFVPIHTGRLVPVYPQTYGISSRTLPEKNYYFL